VLFGEPFRAAGWDRASSLAEQLDRSPGALAIAVALRRATRRSIRVM
jgi:hypothetical protein